MVLHGCHKGLVADFKIIKQNNHVTILIMTIEICFAVYKVTKKLNSQLKVVHVVKLKSAWKLVYKQNPLYKTKYKINKT